jgi:hypothetical protein
VSRLRGKSALRCAVDEIKVVCKGDLDPFDVKVAKVGGGQEALARTPWQSTEVGIDLLLARERYCEWRPYSPHL